MIGAEMIEREISHYKIIEELGRGGMGIVYRAEDTRLKRHVAIKFLPPQFGANSVDRERFKIEAQAAAALNHPNIATIYAIEEYDGELFIAMEYIKGCELKEIIKIPRTKVDIDESGNSDKGEYFSIERVLDLAVQIAAGLQAAHTEKVIHRDIKSSNIMVTDSGQAKIMDFGLAKMQGMNAVSQIGTTVGTVSYMSPQQALGEAVDVRADIWSYGVVLFEMLSGELPFKGVYDQAIFYAIINEEPPDISEIAPEVPESLSKIVKRCLTKELSDRYQTMIEVLQDLQGVSEELGIHIQRIPGSHSHVSVKRIASTLHSRQAHILVALALLLTLLIGIFVPGRNLIRGIFLGAVPDQQHLLVLPFDNVGGNPRQKAFCDGLVETISSKLTQMERENGSLWVVPTSEVRNQNIKSPGEAYAAFGTNLVITGSLQLIKDVFRLTLNLIDAKNVRQLSSRIIDIPKQDVSQLQDASVLTLMKMLNKETDPEFRKKLQSGRSANSSANLNYSQARGYLQRYDNSENLDMAIGLLTHALRLDSNFALAYAGLGEAYWRMYKTTRDVRFAEKAIKAGEDAFRKNPNLLEVNITLGMIHHGTGKDEEAVMDFNRALNMEPTNSPAYVGLAKAYESLNRIDEAEQIYKRAVQIKPDYWAGYSELGVFYYSYGKYEQALDQFQKVVTLTPDNFKAYKNMGGIYYLLERWDDAEKALRKSLQLKKTLGAASNLGIIYFIQGKYEEAANFFKMALEMNDRNEDTWGNLAAAYYWIPGKREKALQLYWHAIDLAEKKKKINPKNVDLISRLGGFYATVGNREKAIAHIEQSLRLAPRDLNVMFDAGTSYEIIGDREKALFWIEKILKKGYPQSDLELQPEMQNLVADPRYGQLLKKLGKAPLRRRKN